MDDFYQWKKERKGNTIWLEKNNACSGMGSTVFLYTGKRFITPALLQN